MLTRLEDQIGLELISRGNYTQDTLSHGKNSFRRGQLCASGLKLSIVSMWILTILWPVWMLTVHAQLVDQQAMLYISLYLDSESKSWP